MKRVIISLRLVSILGAKAVIMAGPQTRFGKIPLVEIDTIIERDAVWLNLVGIFIQSIIPFALFGWFPK